MKKLLFVLFAALTVSACDKDSTSTTTTDDMAEISWVNNTSHSYLINLNGSNVKYLAGGAYWDQEVNPGSFTFKITQQSGYVLYPTVYNGSVTLSAGQKTVISFP